MEATPPNIESLDEPSEPAPTPPEPVSPEPRTASNLRKITAYLNQAAKCIGEECNDMIGQQAGLRDEFVAVLQLLARKRDAASAAAATPDPEFLPGLPAWMDAAGIEIANLGSNIFRLFDQMNQNRNLNDNTRAALIGAVASRC